MNERDWMVLLAGVAAIAWVNWYFFFAERDVASVRELSGVMPEVTITVRGGYSPAEVRARVGVPLRLVFDRRESSSCSEEVVFPDFGIRKFLPQSQRTVVEITPPRAGRFEFTCGMSMLRGAVVAEA